MAEFDQKLDKELFSEDLNFERSIITVSVFSYNNGRPKLQLSRQNKNPNGEKTFAKLGRMTKEEVEAILPVIMKAKTSL